MNDIVKLIASTALLLSGMVMCSVAVTEDFDPFNETKEAYDARAQWFRDAKFGVFIHWNPSSLVGQEISWCRGNVGVEKYDALYKQFKGEKFDAAEWIKLFEEAGIRYSVMVPKHHDGFCMFDTETQDYNVMNSPFGRDFIKEVAEASAGSNVRFGLYYSICDWWNKAYSDAAGADLTEYRKIMKTHLEELFTKYGPIGCVWFDGHWFPSWTHEYGRDLYGFLRRLQPETLLGNRIDQMRTHRADGPYCKWTGSFYDAPDAVGDYQAREVDIGKFYMEKAWDSCYTLNAQGWAWVPPANPRPLPELLNWLIQCIGRDGNMLIGVGPRPDGTIHPLQAKRLLEMGDWLKLNGEAVYGTRGGPYLPGEWGVSTRLGNKVFLFAQSWTGDVLALPALPAKVTSSRLITRGMVRVEAKGKVWRIEVPEQFRRPVATIIELTLDRDVMTLDPVSVPGPDVLSKGKPVTVSGEWIGREKELSKTHVNDGNFGTIWAGPEDSRDAWVALDLGAPYTIGAALLDEGRYNRCRKFELQAQIDGAWKTLAAGTTIGDRKRLTFEPTKARHFRLVVQEAIEVPTVAEFQLFGE